MIKTLRPLSLTLALLALPAASHAADQDFLSAVGDFISKGIAPARTMEDLQRQEREAQATPRSQKAEQPAPKLVNPVEAPKPVAIAEPAEPPAATLPHRDKDIGARPQPVARVTEPQARGMNAEPQARGMNAEPQARIASVEPAARIAPPASRPDILAGPPKARPNIAAKVLPDVVLPPPDPLKTTIAATATVDQALRLGGPSTLYKRQLSTD